MTENAEKIPPFELTADFAATSGVGTALRQARESQGLSIQNAALRLRLGAEQIAAIESEDWQALPGRVFIIGFVRNYARLLGIADVENLIERLQQALQNEEMPKLEIKRGDVIVSQRADHRAMIIALLLLIVVILGFFLLPDNWSNNVLPQKNEALTVEKEAIPEMPTTIPEMPPIPTIPAPVLEGTAGMPGLETSPIVPAPLIPPPVETSAKANNATNPVTVTNTTKPTQPTSSRKTNKDSGGKLFTNLGND